MTAIKQAFGQFVAFSWAERYALLIRIILILVAGAPIIISPGTNGPFAVGRVVYAQAVIEVAFVLWLPLVLLSSKYRPKHSWILMAALAWFGAILLSAIMGPYPSRSLWSTFERMDGVVNWAHFIVYAVMLASVFRTTEQWKWLLRLWVVAAGIIVAIAWLTHFWPEIHPFLAKTHAGTTIRHAVPLGAYLLFAIGFMIALISRTRSKIEIVVWTVVMIASLAIVWQTSGRLAFISIAVVIVFYAACCVLLSKHRVIRLMLLGCLALIFIVIVSFLAFLYAVPDKEDKGYPKTIVRMDNLARGNDNSVSRRLQVATAAVGAYKERPILGYGPENFYLAWGKYAPHNEEWMNDRRMLNGLFNDAHSIYLEVMATTGTVGLLSYGALCILLIRVAYVSLRTPSPNRIFHLAFVSALVGYFVVCAGMVNSSEFAMCVAVMIGYFAYLEQQGHKGRANRSILTWRSPVAWVLIAVIPVILVGIVIINLNILYLSGHVRAPTTAYKANKYYVPETYDRMSAFPPMADMKRSDLQFRARKMAWYRWDPGSKLMDEVERGVHTKPDDWQRALTAAIIHQKMEWWDGAEYYVEFMESHHPTSPYTVVLRRTHEKLLIKAASDWEHKGLP